LNEVQKVFCSFILELRDANIKQLARLESGEIGRSDEGEGMKLITGETIDVLKQHIAELDKILDAAAAL
jgi:hypothetical protein